MSLSNQRHSYIGRSLAVLAAAAVSTAANAGNPVTITDLGTLGGNQSKAYGINNLNQVVGSSVAADGNTYAFLYSGGTMQSLGAVPGSNIIPGSVVTQANSINDSGQITGDWCCSPSGFGDVFLYSSGTLTNLNWTGSGPGGGALAANAAAINNAGQVTGTFYLQSGAYSGLLYSGGVTASAAGPSIAVAVENLAINSKGDYAGDYCDTSDCFEFANGSKAFVQTVGGTSLLIPGLGGDESIARGVNDHDQAVGSSLLTGGNTHAFFYSNNTTLDMGTLGGLNSQADGINIVGLSVGWANTASGAQHAALFFNGHAIDLSTLQPVTAAGWTVLTEATAINNKNEIVGYGMIGGQTHAFLISGISFNY